MLKDIQRGFSKFFTPQRLLILIVFLILGFVLQSYSSSKVSSIYGMEDGYTSLPTSLPKRDEQVMQAPTVLPSESSPHDAASAPNGSGYALRPVANPSELLPVDTNNKWGELNALNQGNIAMPDLLQAGYHIGLDTIGQTLRNANLQERSDPIIPKSDIGPWNQSTIEPDFARTPLEIGYGPR
jgi:hypothetical protein